MAELLEMARQLQLMLDSGTRTGIAGLTAAAINHVSARAGPGGFEEGSAALEPIILRTTLAVSLVGHLERIPWASVTPQMLSEPAGSPIEAAASIAHLLNMLCKCAGCASAASNDSSKVAPVLLRQVRSRSLPFSQSRLGSG